MSDPKTELIRALLNWIIPSALGGAVIQMATKLIDYRESFVGAFLSSLVCFLLGCIVGCLAVLVAIAYQANQVQILAIAIGSSSFTGMIGVKVSKWLIYEFQIGVILKNMLESFFTGLAKWILKSFK